MIRYAIVNGEKAEPVKGLKGFCPGCNTPVTAKCGLIRVHHWAHLQAKDCDPWWEPMTEWHLDWQNQFPPAWREVICRDPDSNEFHRADIHTPSGLTIEFQHSPLSFEEIQRRNDFYNKIVWVVNGQRFKERFYIGYKTPNPQSPLLAKFNFVVNKDGLASSISFQKIDELVKYGTGVGIYTRDDEEMRSVVEQHQNSDQRHCIFWWDHKHATWLNCEAPVFIDLGEKELYWIRRRRQVGPSLLYLQIVTKEEFLAKYAAGVEQKQESPAIQ